MADNEVNITVNLNGPYIVKGQITLMDADGNEFQVKGDRDGTVPLWTVVKQAFL